MFLFLHTSNSDVQSPIILFKFVSFVKCIKCVLMYVLALCGLFFFYFLHLFCHWVSHTYWYGRFDGFYKYWGQLGHHFPYDLSHSCRIQTQSCSIRTPSISFFYRRFLCWRFPLFFFLCHVFVQMVLLPSFYKFFNFLVCVFLCHFSVYEQI